MFKQHHYHKIVIVTTNSAIHKLLYNKQHYYTEGGLHER